MSNNSLETKAITNLVATSTGNTPKRLNELINSKTMRNVDICQVCRYSYRHN